MTTRVVVVDHHDSYTWNLVHLLAEVSGRLPVVVQHDEVTVADVLGHGTTHVVLSPGPGRPGCARDFSVGRDVLRDAEVPVLGVCLGMQGLVEVYAGRVDRVSPAHGEVSDVHHDGTGLLAGLPSPFRAVRYHSLAAVTVPDVLVTTAWCEDPESPDGRQVMGVAHRTRPFWGVQFHPESILTEHGAAMAASFLAQEPAAFTPAFGPAGGPASGPAGTGAAR